MKVDELTREQVDKVYILLVNSSTCILSTIFINISRQRPNLPIHLQLKQY